MALIGSIRKNTTLLIGVIAVAMFAFLLMDGLSSRSRMGGAGNQNVGKIGNQKISAQYFGERYTDYENRIRTFNPQFQSDAAGQAQIRDLVWNEISSEVLLGKNMDNLGLNVSLEELGDAIYGSNVHPYVRQILVNPQTGQYDPQFAFAVIEGVENGDNTQEADIRIITQLKNLIKETRSKEKYSALVSKGMYVPDFLAKDASKYATASADISYIYFPYAEVDDADITVTDKDLQNYLTANAEGYKKEQTRTVEFYKIDIIPSAEDTAKALEDMNDLLADFRNAKNDSMFVRKYSDGLYGLQYFTEDQLAGDVYTANYFSDEVGAFYNPTFANGSHTITKLTDRKLLADSVKASHILLPQPTTVVERDSLQALADSLLELIRNGANFARLAETHSADPRTKNDGGDLGYFTMGDPTIALANNSEIFYVYKQGDAFQALSNAGLSIVQITRAKPVTPAVRLAKVTRKLKFSKQTEKNLLNVQNDFRQKHSTSAEFSAAAEGTEYVINTVDLTKNQVDIPGIGTARDIVRWAFRDKVGTISSFDVNDQYIVAHIKSDTPEGTQRIDQIKGELTQKVGAQKKASLLAKQINDFGVANLQELASKSGKVVKTNAGLSYNFPNIEGNNEPELAGAIFALNDGEMSKPIQGKLGTFVVQLNSKAVSEASNNFEIQKRNLQIPFNYEAALEEIKDKAGVVDTRFMYY